jgi:hypothetical protein
MGDELHRLTSAQQNDFRPRLHFAVGLFSQQARGVESFGKFLSLHPARAMPVMETVFSLLTLLPLTQSGQLPPPPHITPAMGHNMAARMALSKVLLAIAKASPHVSNRLPWRGMVFMHVFICMSFRV